MSDIVSPKIHKSLKVRLYPSEEQKVILNKAFGCCRFVYNRHKEEKDNFYNENIKDKNLSKKEIQKLYKTFKPKTQKEFCDEFEWLRKIPAITVTIPKFKQVKFRHSEDKKGKWIEWFKDATPKNITISKNACGEYWCSILFEKNQDISQSINTNKAIGLDFSPNCLYINNIGESAPNFKKAKQENIKKLTKLQRKFARKQKDSKNREKARIKLAKFENHIANIRNDYREKETLRLVQENDIIGIEDLNIQAMEKFSHNAKNYVDTSWYAFITRLEQKAKFHNCLIIKSDKFYPSSKTCNYCGYVKKDLKLSDRTWICPQCGTKIQRDQNAAKNLKDNALKILVDDIKSALLLEQEEVMPMEDMEVEICNSEIYGVSYEVGKINCEVN